MFWYVFEEGCLKRWKETQTAATRNHNKVPSSDLLSFTPFFYPSVEM